MLHQVEVERQLLRRQLFENGEDVFAARCRQKEIAVFNTGRDAAKLDDIAEIVMPHPLRELGFGDSGEDSHAGDVGSGGRAGAVRPVRQGMGNQGKRDKQTEGPGNGPYRARAGRAGAPPQGKRISKNQ